tara:strand:+ start:1358 stop:1507 length:150 start_codon:yes stop_codon:yes gene_type:complete
MLLATLQEPNKNGSLLDQALQIFFFVGFFLFFSFYSFSFLFFLNNLNFI